MIINKLEYIRDVIPVNNTFDFSRIESFVRDAESIVKNVIGNEMYDELDEHNNADPFVADANFDALIDEIKYPVTFLAFHFGYDMLNTNFSNEGFRRLEDEEQGKLSLYSRQEESLKNTFKQRGYDKLDNILEFLEENISDYPTWATSSAYTNRLENYINSTIEYNELYNINSNRLIFQRLREYQNLCEDFDIEPLIGSDLHAELKDEIKTESLTSVNEKLVNYVKKAVAHLAIWRGGIELAVELTQYGWMKTAFVDNSDNTKEKKHVDKDSLQLIIERAGRNGQAYLKGVESFLKSNLSDYPSYENSDAYDESSSVFGGFDNSGKKIITM